MTGLGKRFRFGIAVKLAAYLAVVLLIFAVLIGIVFTLLFYNYSRKVYVSNTERAAYSIRDMMSSLVAQQGSIVISGDDAETTPEDFFHPGSGFRISKETFGRLVSQLTDSTVWMIAPDATGTSFDMLFLMQSGSYTDTEYRNLPAAHRQFIATVYSGVQKNTTAFSSLLGESTITVGVPILRSDQSVMGVVLVHASASGITEALGSGFLTLLISMLLAFGIGCVFVFLFARGFSKPLLKINDAALLISEGDYTARTDVRRPDEIGMLAGTIDAMGAKLRRAGEESEQLDRMRQDFVANISHELRTPVTVMRGSLEALCEHVVTDPQMIEQYHQELLKESMYMQRLVNDLLDLSRLQNNDFTMNINTFNLWDCVSDAVRSACRVANEKGVRIDFRYDCVEFLLNGDYDRIRQMLLIVLDNAVKFTQDVANPVTVQILKSRVSISNIGVGIRKEDLPHIFDRFYKTRSEVNKNGTGLGLAIAKQIALRHNLGVSVRSVPGGETTFWFDFSAVAYV